jgi:hypothetical protein
MSKLALVLVALVASACTFKSAGPPRAANYDYTEYETYDQPHAQPVSWASGRQGFAPARALVQADAGRAQ